MTSGSLAGFDFKFQIVAKRSHTRVRLVELGRYLGHEALPKRRCRICPLLAR